LHHSQQNCSLEEAITTIKKLLTDKPNVENEQETINKLQDELAEKEEIIAQLQEQLQGPLPTYEESSREEIPRKDLKETTLPATEEVTPERFIELTKKLKETRVYRDAEITKNKNISRQFTELQTNFTENLKEKTQNYKKLSIGLGFLLTGSLFLLASLFKKVIKQKRKKC
jgi:hypothetical protein